MKKHKKYGYNFETCPEAMGVNVTKTMSNAGIILEWPPENIAYKIAIAGILKIKSKRWNNEN
jgi:predicted metal-binding protein